MNNIDINKLIDRYRMVINNITYKYKYPNNISHILYIIFLSFIIKYGIEKDRLIINTLENVPIIIKDNQDKVHQAFYSSIPFRENNIIKTKKIIVLNNYDSIFLTQLLDNLIHEYNHAINSYNKEINIMDNKIYLRTGLTYMTYDFETLRPIGKDNSYILEEILNTNQTESLINIILSIDINSINDNEIKNTMYAIRNEINNSYRSGAYGLQTYICKYLLSNKTFISTLNNLRISGDTSDINDWFNNITNINNSYIILIDDLIKIVSLEKDFSTKKIKIFTINKIKKLNDEIVKIIECFNNNCTYK